MKKRKGISMVDTLLGFGIIVIITAIYMKSSDAVINSYNQVQDVNSVFFTNNLTQKMIGGYADSFGFDSLRWKLANSKGGFTNLSLTGSDLLTNTAGEEIVDTNGKTKDIEGYFYIKLQKNLCKNDSFLEYGNISESCERIDNLSAEAVKLKKVTNPYEYNIIEIVPTTRSGFSLKLNSDLSLKKNFLNEKNQTVEQRIYFKTENDKNRIRFINKIKSNGNYERDFVFFIGKRSNFQEEFITGTGSYNN